MAVIPALATAETGHYEDEDEHPQTPARGDRAATLKRNWVLTLSGAPKDEPAGTTGLFSSLAARRSRAGAGIRDGATIKTS
jgi:hypothetical protein